LVLGAGVREGKPSQILEDRLATALDLYRASKVREILVSGGAHPERDEVSVMRRWLLAEGVPAAQIRVDDGGLTTRLSVQRAVQLFDVTDTVICTQRFHMPRALFLARAAGISAVGLEADRRVYRKRARDAVREFFAQALSVLEA
jgi:SanA protein